MRGREKAVKWSERHCELLDDAAFDSLSRESAESSRTSAAADYILVQFLRKGCLSLSRFSFSSKRVEGKHACHTSGE